MKKGELTILSITICVIVFLISKFICALLIYRRWRNKRRVCQEASPGGRIVLFRWPEKSTITTAVLLRKTRTLTSKDIIGTGGFGTVYKLVYDEKTAFAVKKLLRYTGDKDRSFERELEAMGDIKHRNILTLRGYYKASSMNLLIYDLMQNGSLDRFLHNKSSNIEPLSWATRYKIALGAARGIAYLHHDCIPHIIHRDIKPSNILLDEEMKARISDFGLATLMSPDQSHVSTYVAGTFGYLAPEYVETGRATEKGDVYSYGVVLLELITGKRPNEESPTKDGKNMVSWVKACVEVGCWKDVIDPHIGNTPELEQIKHVLDVACKCVSESTMERPTMAQVARLLDNINTTHSNDA